MKDKKKEYKLIQDWRRRNPDKVKQYRKRYNKKHPYSSLPEEKKKHRAEVQRKWRENYKELAIDKYGAECSCCGTQVREFLCFDHIEGGGNKHRKIMTTRAMGVWLYQNNYPSGFQLLCYNCNAVKELFEECPCKVLS